MTSSEDWSAEFLESKRQVADPQADALVAEVLERGVTQTWDVTRLFSLMSRNDSPVPDALPDTMKAYFGETKLPPWADMHKINRGEKLFGTYGIEIVLLLFCKALPLTYCCRRGAEVLVKTGRMTEKTLIDGEDFSVINRRLMETAQFILNVMAHGGFEAGGRGLRTAQKIRLIHACIRYYLLKQGWDAKSLGMPINQEDIAGTLMSFSYCMIEGLEQLDIEVEPEDKEAYLHCWKVVGYFIGLEESLMPGDYPSAEQLTRTILARESGPSTAGKLLAKSLTDYMASMMPFGFGRYVPPLLIRCLIGHNAADDLGVRRIQIWEEWLVRLCFRIGFDAVGDLKQNSHWLSKLARRASRKLLQSLVIKNNDYKNIRFYMPPSLQGNWNI